MPLVGVLAACFAGAAPAAAATSGAAAGTAYMALRRGAEGGLTLERGALSAAGEELGSQASRAARLAAAYLSRTHGPRPHARCGC